jgi:hypothetical protein
MIVRSASYQNDLGSHRISETEQPDKYLYFFSSSSSQVP